ncbi:MAG TPA: TatD family hydrolase [Luteolibacter sp.]|nr:TatD family hydrolase [Luteolibacter sp.]
MTGWFDAHNHLHDARLGDPVIMLAAMREAGVEHCVVNATCEADWPAVEALASGFPETVTPAFGIHPWKADIVSEGWRERLAAILEKHPRAVIGECGLDRWVAAPSVEVQLPVFETQLDLARETDRPVVIHCLKAWGHLIDALSAHPPPRFLMHSFNGSLETARRLLPLGAWFSFSGHFLHERKEAVREVFRELPRDRILVETDAPDMLPPPANITHPLAEGINHPANLPAIGEALADLLETDRDEFAALTRTNTLAWLNG